MLGRGLNMPEVILGLFVLGILFNGKKQVVASFLVFTEFEVLLSHRERREGVLGIGKKSDRKGRDAGENEQGRRRLSFHDYDFSANREP